MSFFSDILSSVFGDTDTSSQEAQIASNAAALAQIARLSEQARQDVSRIFPSAIEASNLGFQGALDVLGQTIPQQLGAFQQGNVGAQQSLLSGLPQFQNAILGGNVNLGALTPQTIGFDAGFANQTLPQLDLSALTLPPPTPPGTPIPTPTPTPTGGVGDLGTVVGGPGVGGEGLGGGGSPGNQGDGAPGGGGGGAAGSVGASGFGNIGGPFGVLDVSNPFAQLALTALPGGSLANAAIGLGNLSNIQDVQGSLGLEQSSLFNAINPFSQLAQGSTTASLGNVQGTPVTFGGLTPSGTTSFTPQEALARQFFGGLPNNQSLAGLGVQAEAIGSFPNTPSQPGLATPTLGGITSNIPQLSATEQALIDAILAAGGTVGGPTMFGGAQGSGQGGSGQTSGGGPTGSQRGGTAGGRGKFG